MHLISPEGDDDADSGDTDSSSEVPGAETCAICLGCMRGEVGSPEACEHTFCLICILEWAKTNPSCPQDRKAFTKVLVRLTLQTEKVDREIPIKKQESELVLISETDNPTYCEVCNECDREERLLLCDGCDLGYHLECLDPPLDQVPVEEWFCPSCTSAELPSTDPPKKRCFWHFASASSGDLRRIMPSLFFHLPITP
ncbi:PHD and RING finger domain-containing protein 1 [Portunus trituberculatus]|uniref:PHD and RING finger domain-containing protein 1 n=1 Tax=Portunus trituberculatus TaxID=210409 RepID=A0A5B7GKR2_PORTR|nr:PHD and RING finger domain-containing protein 1 [Portunus trituberculatus]